MRTGIKGTESLLQNARRAAGFPISCAGAIVWVVAAALLITADAITGRDDGDQLLRLKR